MRLTVVERLEEWEEEPTGEGCEPRKNYEMFWTIILEVWDDEPWPIGRDGKRYPPEVTVRRGFEPEISRIEDEEGPRDCYTFEIPSEGPAFCSACGARHWKEWQLCGWYFTVRLDRRGREVLRGKLGTYGYWRGVREDGDWDLDRYGCSAWFPGVPSKFEDEYRGHNEMRFTKGVWVS